MSLARAEPKWLYMRAESQVSGGTNELSWPTDGKGGRFTTTGATPAVTPPASSVISGTTPVRIHRIETMSLNSLGTITLRDWLSTKDYLTLTLVSTVSFRTIDLNISLPRGFSVYSTPATTGSLLGAVAVYFSPEEGR